MLFMLLSPWYELLIVAFFDLTYFAVVIVDMFTNCRLGEVYRIFIGSCRNLPSCSFTSK